MGDLDEATNRIAAQVYMETCQPELPSDPSTPSITSPSTSSATHESDLGFPYTHITFTPMVEVVTTLIYGAGLPKFKIILGTQPFEEDPPKDSCVHLQVINGKLVKDESGSEIHGLPTKPPQGKNKLEFTIMTLRTWERTINPSHKLRCQCSPQFTGPRERHSDRRVCRTRAMGAYVATLLHNKKQIEGTPVPAELLTKV